MAEKKKQSSSEADVTIDALGKKCPMPILMLRDNLDQVNVGQIVELVSDDAGSKSDVPAFCRRTGHKILKTWEDKGAFHFLVKKAK